MAKKLELKFGESFDVLSEFPPGHISTCHVAQGPFELDGTNLQVQTHFRFKFILWQRIFCSIGP